MSKIKILAVLIILIGIGVVFLFSQYINSNQLQLVNPQLEKIFTSIPTSQLSTTDYPSTTLRTSRLQTSTTPTPTNIIPKEIQYDSTTDLKKELDKINPVVLEEDFQNLP